MMGDRYVLLVWSSLLLPLWVAFYVGRPACRPALVWSSLFALPFGLSEVMFAGSYWSPPSLLDLARRIHLDVESFVFLFGAGGVAAVLYDVPCGRCATAPGRAKTARPRQPYRAGLAAPALAFPLALLVWHRPIEAGVVAMGVGALARIACRPDLLPKTLVGGLMFLALYVALLESLVHAEPGYIDRVWSPVVLRSRVAGVPRSEILFGGAFGAYWSGLYEHWMWTFGRANVTGERPVRGRGAPRSRVARGRSSWPAPRARCPTG